MKSFIREKINLNHFMGFFFLAVLLLWLKTYAVQITQFNLGVENSIQSFLLFLSPLASGIIFLGLAMFKKGKKKYSWLIGLYFVLSFLLYANVLYYRFFNDFITLPTFFQTQNFGDVSSSVYTLMHSYDILFFVDFLILAVLASKRTKFVQKDYSNISRRKIAAVMLLGLGIFSANLGMAEADRPQLLTRTFDRNYIVKYLGMYNYTIYDAVQSTKASAQRVMADSSDVVEVINYTQSQFAEPNPEYFGVAEGRNVIYIHLESIQNFLIDYELHGEEVMPFLNSLVRDPNSLYFDNFYHQTAQGKTADAEFMLENSLFGLPQGSAFSMKGLNTYHSAPAILAQEQGYTSAVFHGNTRSFWNRDEIYKSFGFDKFFDSSYYDMSPENVTNYGLMDKPFFKESIPLLQALPQPFYSKFIMLTHHYPFTMNQEEATIEPHYTGSKTVDNFFQTARYSDEALEQFFNDLKESGLYDNSIIIMYGDHYGISQNHNRAMETVLGREVTPSVTAELQEVPLIIHTPGLKGGVNHTYGGQVDLLPTLLHLLGINAENFVHLGTDLLSKDHRELVAFRNGDFVSPNVTFIESKFYDPNTGELLEETEEFIQLKQIARQQLELSDKVVNGDLLRFYTPDNFTPVQRSIYNYNFDESYLINAGISLEKEETIEEDGTNADNTEPITDDEVPSVNEE
ncbi:LTA synthase family protein [Bacillus sp. B15-48]|uniref:LTA synthase family protein n=1 Tax=Bacillus sp. B15-48 TaxID=1548601 RepID=UPI00193FB7DB|nr:LTA synthase family protein [Bacillus sp. B15-48]MBM4760687.1 sulfatase-like hydrolase/transferase [Bacillus sp. B15-48]